ncbi:MAG: DUF5130 family protein [Nocardioidaceae bacterium]|nr:DUF5130 family protein [Nocardioidaceae bacterium]
MPAGEAFTPSQRLEIEKAVRVAERMCGRDITVHVGTSTGDVRAYAEGLHADLVRPPGSILIHVDPDARAVEIVTGAEVRRVLGDRQAALAAITMQTAFVTGDLMHGLLAGLHQLARLARPTQSLHTDTP